MNKFAITTLYWQNGPIDAKVQEPSCRDYLEAVKAVCKITQSGKDVEEWLDENGVSHENLCDVLYDMGSMQNGSVYIYCRWSVLIHCDKQAIAFRLHFPELQPSIPIIELYNRSRRVTN